MTTATIEYTEGVKYIDGSPEVRPVLRVKIEAPDEKQRKYIDTYQRAEPPYDVASKSGVRNVFERGSDVLVDFRQRDGVRRFLNGLETEGVDVSHARKNLQEVAKQYEDGLAAQRRAKDLARVEAPAVRYR